MFSELQINEWQTQQNNAPFIYFMQKGNLSSKVTKSGNPTDKFISLDATMKNQWFKGNIISEVAGPAKKWTNLHWGYHSLESNSKDSINIMITGQNALTNNW